MSESPPICVPLSVRTTHLPDRPLSMRRDQTTHLEITVYVFPLKFEEARIIPQLWNIIQKLLSKKLKVDVSNHHNKTKPKKGGGTLPEASKFLSRAANYS